MSSVPNLDFLFNPRSVAVVGVSGDGDEANSGRRYVQSMVNCGFRGPIYAVNNSGGEMDGAMIYSSVRDIPHSVDFVISAIPAQFTPQLVADCAARGVKAIHFFSSGFAEIEDKRGRQLESEILSLARQSGIRIVGPNCMGLYCPGSGLSFCKDFPRQRGPLAVIAQSGGKSYHFIREASTRGLYLSKVISYGNAIDVDECDFLEYFADDPETKVICTYTEGVRDGRRFARALRKITGAKPVIMYKAGTTDDGIRIVASHTNSLAG